MLHLCAGLNLTGMYSFTRDGKLRRLVRLEFGSGLQCGTAVSQQQYRNTMIGAPRMLQRQEAVIAKRASPGD